MRLFDLRAWSEWTNLSTTTLFSAFQCATYHVNMQLIKYVFLTFLNFVFQLFSPSYEQHYWWFFFSLILFLEFDVSYLEQTLQGKSYFVGISRQVFIDKAIHQFTGEKSKHIFIYHILLLLLYIKAFFFI